MSMVTTVKYGKITWVDIVNPTEKETNMLEKKYGFHELDLDDCLSKIQRSKIDEYDDYLFLVLHFPHYDGRRKHVATQELDCFIGQDFIITLHSGKLKTMDRLLKECQSKDKKLQKDYMGQGTGYFLYVMIRELFDAGFPLLDDMERAVTTMESDLFEGNTQRDMVRDILWLKKDVINFRRVISPQRAVIAQLEHKNKKFLPEDLEVYFDDVVDKIEKIWSSLENLKELMETIQDTNEVLISHQTNKVIKILTVFSVVLLPLTLITGFYGMNVALPHGANPYAAAGIGVGMLVILAGMLIFFKVKRWL
jgi:magnesium transporter